MKRLAWILAAGVALSAEAQWTPRPTATPRPTPRPTVVPTPQPTVVPTPTPQPTAPPAGTPTPGGAPCSCDRTPLLRLRPGPLLVAVPAVGELLPCSFAMAPFGCTPGTPVEIELFHSDAADAKPAVYRLVRVR